MYLRTEWDSNNYLQQYASFEFPDEEDESEEEQTFIHWPRDPKLDPAKGDLMDWFNAHPETIFYGRQIEVIHEKKYFHWITHKALRELTKEEAISTELRMTRDRYPIRLYWSKRLRYPKRAIVRLVREVELHSDPEITRAIGNHAEALFGFAAARARFAITGPNVNSYQGKIWQETEHELDWILERDGVAWGVEIKNTWAYIDRPEMYTKIALCEYLGLRPLFIMRWAPKSYIQVMRERNGFGLLYEDQYFPPGHSGAVDRLKALFLPVVITTAVAPGVFERFVHWHERELLRDH